jgi:magnesium transporter
MITAYRWSPELHSLEALDANELMNSTQPCLEKCKLWIDLSDPSPEEEELIFRKYHQVHDLTLEDITKPRREPNDGAHLPKVEEFKDYLFVIVNPLPLPMNMHSRTTKRRPQLSAIISDNVLITHHYDSLNCIVEINNYIKRHSECAGRGPDYLFHLILDNLVDEYSPVVEQLSDRLDVLETKLFRKPTPSLLRELIKMKRKVAFLRKTLILEREVLARLTRGEFALVDQREIAYYRNVYDHLIRYTELVESSREMVSDLMQSYLAASSNKLNEIMKILTMLSTIGVVCTVIAGVYGMNFEIMPELKWQYGYPFALGLMLCAAAGTYSLFKWKQWV